MGCVQRERAGGSPTAGLVLLRVDGEQTGNTLLLLPYSPWFKTPTATTASDFVVIYIPIGEEHGASFVFC